MYLIDQESRVENRGEGEEREVHNEWSTFWTVEKHMYEDGLEAELRIYEREKKKEGKEVMAGIQA